MIPESYPLTFAHTPESPEEQPSAARATSEYAARLEAVRLTLGQCAAVCLVEAASGRVLEWALARDVPEEKAAVAAAHAHDLFQGGAAAALSELFFQEAAAPVEFITRDGHYTHIYRRVVGKGDRVLLTMYPPTVNLGAALSESRHQAERLLEE